MGLHGFAHTRTAGQATARKGRRMSTSDISGAQAPNIQTAARRTSPRRGAKVPLKANGCADATAMQPSRAMAMRSFMMLEVTVNAEGRGGGGARKASCACQVGRVRFYRGNRHDSECGD